MVRILIVEDDATLSEQIKVWLSYEFQQVETSGDGTDALRRLAEQQFDLIVLDWVLPGTAGVDVCREFRLRGGQTPIIMLSAKEKSDEKVMALDAGADDYLSKPFHPKELTARLNALLRRQFELKPALIRVGDIELDTVSHKAYKDGAELVLAPREMALLQFFMENPNRAFTASQILDQLWSAESEVSPSVVKVYVNKLRKRLGDLGATVDLRTTRGAGYVLATGSPVIS